MSTLARRLIILALGLLAGMCAWPVVELVLHFQDSFASYRLFLPVLGAVTGAVMGAFFGAAEGITSRVKSRIRTGCSSARRWAWRAERWASSPGRPSSG